MKLSNAEMKLEREHLESVKDIINENINKSNLSIEDYKKEVVGKKRFLWENLSDYSDVEMYATMNDEDDNVALINKDIVKTYKLYRSLERPYFGRIDFNSQGKNETFYFGLTGVDREYEPVVYDWRTSVANLYYNYGLGRAEYQTPEGNVLGDITLKRQFKIENGNLISAYDTSTTINDELLENVMEDNTSDHMKNIVMSIEEEQNAIIRSGLKDNIIVEGVAGSGKTSIAMHRIAYMLYNDRLDSSNVLIFSPNDNFSEYISRVLPEMGEENVPTITFKNLVEDLTGIKAEGLIDFIDSKKVPQKEEHSFKYKKEIDEYLVNYFDSLKFTKKIGLKNEFITSSELNSIKNSIPKNLKFYDKMRVLSEKICARFKIDEVKNSDKMLKALRKNFGLKAKAKEIYEEFTGESIQDYIPYSDTIGIIYLYFEMNGYPEFGYIKRVIIDEAQDYTPWQMELIKEIFKSATFMVLGDRNQIVNPFCDRDDFLEFKGIFSNSKYYRLTKSYRSSKAIVEYSNKIIGSNDAKPVRESRNEIFKLKKSENFDSLKEDIHIYKEKGFKRIGVIVKDKDEVESIRTIVQDEALVYSVYDAKGLEFDAVIVVTRIDDAYTKDEANLLYIAVTRALHALVVYNQNI